MIHTNRMNHMNHSQKGTVAEFRVYKYLAEDLDDHRIHLASLASPYQELDIYRLRIMDNGTVTIMEDMIAMAITEVMEATVVRAATETTVTKETMAITEVMAMAIMVMVMVMVMDANKDAAKTKINACIMV